MLVKVRVALTAPATCGLKVTVKEALLPAAMVTGKDRPRTLNTELFVLAAVTVTLAPLAVRVPDAVPLVPATTLPKSWLAGLSVSCPGVPAAVPVPCRVKFGALFDALLAIVTLALKLPAALGVNWMLIEALCPAAMVTGRLGPVRVVRQSAPGQCAQP